MAHRWPVLLLINTNKSLTRVFRLPGHQLGFMLMLNWFKRSATPAPHEQLVKNENQTPPLEDRVEQLVGRPGTTAYKLGAGLTQMRVIVVASQKGGAGK